MQTISKWREQAAQAFSELGFPHRKTENWRYTNVKALQQKEWQVQPAVSLSADEVLSHSCLASLQNRHRLFILDGMLLQNDAYAQPINAVLDDAVVQASLSSLSAYQTGRDQHAFLALNTASFERGIYLNLTEDPKQVLHLLCYQSEQAEMLHVRNLIRVAANVKAELIIEYVGNTGEYWHNVVTQIELAEGAALKYSLIQHESAQATHVNYTDIKLEKNAALCGLSMNWQGGLIRNDLHISLQGEGAVANLLGFYYAEQKQHSDHHTRIDHLASNTSSGQLYKGLAKDKAHAVFNGKVLVHPGVKAIKAEQANHNLLLSKAAVIDAKPELEIYADDVTCSHGATVGQLDEEALFYLQSRGIALAQARHLLTCAFAGELLDILDERDMAELLQQQVAQCMADNTCNGECAHD